MFKRIESIKESKEVFDTPSIGLSKTRGKLDISNKAAEVLGLTLGTDHIGLAEDEATGIFYITNLGADVEGSPKTTKSGKVSNVLYAYESLETKSTKFVLSSESTQVDGLEWFALEAQVVETPVVEEVVEETVEVVEETTYDEFVEGPVDNPVAGIATATDDLTDY